MTGESYNDDLNKIIVRVVVLTQLDRGFDVKFNFSEYMKLKISKANKRISVTQKNKTLFPYCILPHLNCGYRSSDFSVTVLFQVNLRMC